MAHAVHYGQRSRRPVRGLRKVKYRPKTKPFPHQARGTLAAARARNYALFFEPRCGKSKSALDVVGIHALAGRVRRVLVLAPRIALPVWEDQIEQHYPYWYDAETFEEEWSSSTTIFAGSPPEVRFFLASREEVFRRTVNTKKQKYERPKQKILEEWNPDLIIVDESHEYKRPGGVAAQDLWRMVRRLRLKRNDNGQPWVILLSGTPTPKGWIDLFAQFRVLDESIFDTAANRFEERYVVRGKGRRKWTILAYRHERELERKIRDHSYSVSADEAGLANKEFLQKLAVDLPASAKKLYLDLASEFVAEWEGNVITAKNAGVKRLRLLQITGGFSSGGIQIHHAKLEVLRAYAKLLLEQGESLVVYSRFTPEVESVTALLDGVGFVTHRVDGTVRDRDRTVAIRSLARRPSTPTALSFQYQAGSRAIELVGAAETVYYTTPDGWVDYRQTKARTQGPNQRRPVRYTHLICPGTVDVSVVKALQKKEDIHDAMMRDPRAFLMGLV